MQRESRDRRPLGTYATAMGSAIVGASLSLLLGTSRLALWLLFGAGIVIVVLGSLWSHMDGKGEA